LHFSFYLKHFRFCSFCVRFKCQFSSANHSSHHELYCAAYGNG